MPRRLLQQITAYIAVERAHAVTKVKTREGWLRSSDRSSFVTRRLAR